MTTILTGLFVLAVMYFYIKSFFNKTQEQNNYEEFDNIDYNAPAEIIIEKEWIPVGMIIPII